MRWKVTGVNFQGYEPLISPQLISQVATLLNPQKDASVSTACHEIRDAASLSSPNVVKVVMDAKGYALYFSRSQIPYPREAGGAYYPRAGSVSYRGGRRLAC